MRPQPTRRRSTLLRRLLLVAASFVLGIAGWFLLGESESLTASEGPQRSVLARVDGIAITEDEVLALAADELGELERQRREVIARTAREAVHRHLIAAEAARRGITVDDLLAAAGQDRPEAYAHLIARLADGHTIEYLAAPDERLDVSDTGG